MRPYADTYLHTAHQLGPARILYPFHAFFGRQVFVVSTRKRVGIPEVMVRLERSESDHDGTSDIHIVIPSWMLDANACAMVDVRETVQLSSCALLQLRELIDQLAISLDESHDGSASVKEKGDSHEARFLNQAACQDAAPKTSEP